MKRLSGNKLKKLRELRGLNKNQLAKALGVQFKDITRYEKDAVRFPEMKTVKRLSLILKCKPDELLEDGTYKLKPCVVCGKLINPDRGRKACGSMHVQGTCSYKRHQSNMKKNQERYKSGNCAGRPKTDLQRQETGQLTLVEVPNYADETTTMTSVVDEGIISVHSEVNQGGVWQGEMPNIKTNKNKREYYGFYDCTTHI
jgi:DNA-binding XRE family transcriptional regulator